MVIASDTECLAYVEGERNDLLRVLRAVGYCPCQTGIEDPGDHIATCPNTDLNHTPDDSFLPPSLTVFHCRVCDAIAGVTRNGGPPPICCGRATDHHAYSRVDDE